MGDVVIAFFTVGPRILFPLVFIIRILTEYFIRVGNKIQHYVPPTHTLGFWTDFSVYNSKSWNTLEGKQEFSLLCFYPVNIFENLRC